MTAVRYITLAILLLCMFNAAVCMNIPALIVLTCLSALVLACKNPLSSGIWAQIGILLFGITVMLWAGSRTPVLFLSCLTATLLLTSVVLRIPSLLLLGILVQPLAVRHTLTYAFAPTMEVRGDWTLAEDNEAKYATLFASSFIHSDKFPLWQGPSHGKCHPV